MVRLPVIDFTTMKKILIKLGFKEIRQRGSHVFFKHDDGRTTTVPNHKGRDLAVPLTRAILKDIQLSTDDFIKLLEKI